jgi:hypothetical protein
MLAAFGVDDAPRHELRKARLDGLQPRRSELEHIETHDQHVGGGQHDDGSRHGRRRREGFPERADQTAEQRVRKRAAGDEHEDGRHALEAFRRTVAAVVVGGRGKQETAGNGDAGRGRGDEADQEDGPEASRTVDGKIRAEQARLRSQPTDQEYDGERAGDLAELRLFFLRRRAADAQDVGLALQGVVQDGERGRAADARQVDLAFRSVRRNGRHAGHSAQLALDREFAAPAMHAVDRESMGSHMNSKGNKNRAERELRDSYSLLKVESAILGSDGTGTVSGGR